MPKLCKIFKNNVTRGTKEVDKGGYEQFRCEWVDVLKKCYFSALPSIKHASYPGRSAQVLMPSYESSFL